MASRVAAQDLVKFCDQSPDCGIWCHIAETTSQFTFANSESTKCNHKLVVCMYDRENVVQSTEFDIVEQGHVPILMSLPQMRNLRFQFELHPDKALLSSPVLGIWDVKLKVAPSSHLVLDLLDLSRLMWNVRFDKHKKKAKCEPKDGFTPIPLEFLDTKRKTIMEIHKGKSVVKEDDWRSGELPTTKSTESWKGAAGSSKRTGAAGSFPQGKVAAPPLAPEDDPDLQDIDPSLPGDTEEVPRGAPEVSSLEPRRIALPLPSQEVSRASPQYQGMLGLPGEIYDKYDRIVKGCANVSASQNRRVASVIIRGSVFLLITKKSSLVTRLTLPWLSLMVRRISCGLRPLRVWKRRRLWELFALADDGYAEKVTVRQAVKKAIDFVYAGGEASPGPGTVIKYGNYMFYAKLDFESFLNHGHELYLTSNGVVLAYADVAPMYLTFHCRPPHEMEAGGLRYEKKQHEAGVGSSREEGTSASASASATGDSPQGEVPGSASEPKTKPMPKKRPRTAAQAADASPPNGRLSTGRGYGLHFFLKEFELRKLTGKYLVEFQHKPKVYTNGYRSPYEKYERRFPVGIAAMLNDLTQAEKMEFRPMVKDIGFPRPRPDDPRARKPKVDEADYAEKLKAHNAFLKEREVYQEIQYVRDDFSLLTSVVAEAYGPNFFSYITRNSSDFEMRKKCQGKDFKSTFARKAKSDLIAYESLREKRQAELEEPYTRPFEDIAVEENRGLTSGEMSDTAKTEAPDVPMETEAPESSPQEEASGVKVEPTEDSPQREESETKDEHMGATEEFNDEAMAPEGSPEGEESMPPDISPERDDGKAAASAEAKNEKAFENMENANDKKDLERAEEFKYFCEVIFAGRSPMPMLVEQKDGYSTTGLYQSGI
eukprot:s3642_g3.t1